MENILHKGESTGTKNADKTAGDAQDAIINKTNGVIKGNIETSAENRGESLDRSVDHVGNHRCNKSGYQDFAFHALQIQYFRCQDAAPQRCFEDGGNPCPRTGCDRDAAVFNREMYYLGDKRPETGTHLGGRALWRRCLQSRW